MSDDKIKLPDFLIADLYKMSLVELKDTTFALKAVQEEKSTSQRDTFTSKIIYTGNNSKKVTIIFSGVGSTKMPATDLSFLTNILKACDLILTDIAVVNVAQQKISFEDVKEQLQALQIILFNVEPSVIGLPFSIPAFQVQHYAGCTIMIAPALTQLNQSSPEGKLLKTKLWNALKQVFGIN